MTSVVVEVTDPLLPDPDSLSGRRIIAMGQAPVEPGERLAQVSVRDITRGAWMIHAFGRDDQGTVVARSEPVPMDFGPHPLQTTVRLSFVGTDTVNTLTISPTQATLLPGGRQPFTARDQNGLDITSAVDWTSSNPVVASIDASGVAIAQVPGDTTIRASFGELTATALLTVSQATLVTLAVEPTTASILVGDSQAFTASGTLSDGSLQDLTDSVTWTSTDPAVASINSAGTALGLSPGSTLIRADFQGLQNAATLDVSDVPPPPPPPPPLPPPPPPPPPPDFLGLYVNEGDVVAGDGRLRALQVDPATGLVVGQAPGSPFNGPTPILSASGYYMAVDPSGQFLFASFTGGGPDQMQGYTILRPDGNVSAPFPAIALPADAQGTTVHPTNNKVYFTLRTAGRGASLDYDPTTGEISNLVLGPAVVGDLTDLAITPNGNHCYMTDQDNGVSPGVHVFDIDAAGQLVNPRFFAFPLTELGYRVECNAAGDRLFVTSAIASPLNIGVLRSFSIDANGDLGLLDTQPIDNSATGLVVTNVGGFDRLYVVCRGADPITGHIFVFTVDGAGLMTQIDLEATGKVTERGALSPDGRFFYVLTHNGFSAGPDNSLPTDLLGFDVQADGTLDAKPGFPVQVGPNPFDLVIVDL